MRLLGFVFPGDPGVPELLSLPNGTALPPAWALPGTSSATAKRRPRRLWSFLQPDQCGLRSPTERALFRSVDAYNGNWTNPFTSTGTTAPPVAPTGKFGCVPIPASPGVNCPLFPLPVFGSSSRRQLADALHRVVESVEFSARSPRPRCWRSATLETWGSS